MWREKEQGERKKCEWVGVWDEEEDERQKGTNTRKTEKRQSEREMSRGQGWSDLGNPW